MLPATITLKGIWAAIIATAFAFILVLLAVQTVRLEGFKIWPISVEGWKPKAELLQLDLDHVKEAQGIALQKAVAAKAATEKQYVDLAERTDTNEQKIRADAMADAERYIAANRMRSQATGSTRSGATPTSKGDAAEGSNRPSGEAVLDADLIGVTADDVRVCTTNTTRLEAVREWALKLGEVR